MIISHRHKFIFIKTVKTAGTSIEVFLARVAGDDAIVTPVYPSEAGHNPRNWQGFFNPIPEILLSPRSLRTTPGEFFRRQKFYNHIPAFKVQQRVEPEVWNSYFKFCVERNPWDKTVSHYSMLKARAGGALDFDTYLARGELCFNLHRYCDPRNGALLVDRVLRYESLAEQFGDVCRQLGIPYTGSIEVRAKGNYRERGSDFRSFYSQPQAEMVGRLFVKEIALHGYRFEEES